MVHSERQALGAQIREQARSADGTDSPPTKRAIRKATRFIERAEARDNPADHFGRAFEPAPDRNVYGGVSIRMTF